MDQVSRAPRNVAPISRLTLRRYSNTFGTVTPSWKTSNQTYFSDLRPSYAYGPLVKIDGGTFRKPTSYQHRSYQVTVNQPFIGRNNGFSPFRYGIDEGRESGAIAARYGKSLFGGTDYPSTSSFGMNEAIVKALLQLADQKAGLGEDLAQFNQIFRLFVGKASITYEALRSLRSRRSFWKFMRQSAKDLSSRPLTHASRAYIEYVYGIRPLVIDLYGTYELLKKQKDKLFLLHGHGRSSRTESTADSAVQHGFSYSDCKALRREETAEFRCDLWAQIDPAYAGLRALNQLGLLNPVSLAWNLVPWSFIVDWFVPIGSVLEAFTAPVGLKFVGGSKATRSSGIHTIEFRINSTFMNPDSLSTTILNKGEMIVEYQGYNRTALTSWPIPGFYFSTDPFRGDRPYKALALAILQLGKWSHSNPR